MTSSNVNDFYAIIVVLLYTIHVCFIDSCDELSVKSANRSADNAFHDGHIGVRSRVGRLHDAERPLGLRKGRVCR